MNDKLIDYFRVVLSDQMLADKDKMDHIIHTEDVTLEDIVAVGGQNAPWIEKMKNGKFRVTAKVAGMTAYAGAQGGGVHRSVNKYGDSEVESRFVRAYYTMSHEQLVAATEDDAAAIRVAEDYSDGIKMAMAQAKSRHLRGDGSGIGWVLPAGVQTGTEITISERAVGTIESQNFYGLGTDEFQPGTKIVFGTKAQLALGAGGTAVEATIEDIVDEGTLKLTASVSVGAASGANNRAGTNADTVYIVRGTKAENEYDKSPVGLFGLIDDGEIAPEIQGKTRSSTSWMKSIVLYRSSTSTIVKDLQTLYTQFRKYGKPEYFRMSSDLYEKYTAALTLNMTQTRGDYKTKLGSGHTGLAFTYGNNKEIPILQDLFMPYGTVFLIDPMAFFEANMFDEDFIPGYFMKPIDAGTAIEYETVRGAYMNFGTWGSRKNGARLHYTAY